MNSETSTLLVKGMPPFRSDEHKLSFYRQLGAVHSIAQDSDGAIIIFPDVASAKSAFEKLQQLSIQMEGRTITATYYPDIPEGSAPKPGTQSGYPPDHHLNLPPSERQPETLNYSYPPPNAEAIANLAYHMWTNEKFYVGVMAVAEKLNLPYPFEPLPNCGPDAVTHFVRVYPVSAHGREPLDSAKRPRMENWGYSYQAEGNPAFQDQLSALAHLANHNKTDRISTTPPPPPPINKPPELYNSPAGMGGVGPPSGPLLPTPPPMTSGRPALLDPRPGNPNYFNPYAGAQFQQPSNSPNYPSEPSSSGRPVLLPTNGAAMQPKRQRAPLIPGGPMGR